MNRSVTLFAFALLSPALLFAGCTTRTVYVVEGERRAEARPAPAPSYEPRYEDPYPGYDIRDPSDFYEPLSPYGRWIPHPRYGYVFAPYGHIVGPGFRPYTQGTWVYTEWGWTWQSDLPFGWATFHYGRWFYDSRYGWCWVPDTVWAPAWVTWRYGGGYVGWAPLPPGAVYGGSYVVYETSWVFVETRSFGGARVSTVYVTGPRYRECYLVTRPARQTVVVRDRVVYRGPEPDDVRRRGGRVVSRPAGEVDRPPARGGRDDDRATADRGRGGSRGRSGDAPGHAGEGRGRSDEAPGRNPPGKGGNRGRSGSAPGHDDDSPGRAEEAPGRNPPGKKGNRGRSGAAPGHNDEGPGAEEAPGRDSRERGDRGRGSAEPEHAHGNGHGNGNGHENGNGHANGNGTGRASPAGGDARGPADDARPPPQPGFGAALRPDHREVRPPAHNPYARSPRREEPEGGFAPRGPAPAGYGHPASPPGRIERPRPELDAMPRAARPLPPGYGRAPSSEVGPTPALPPPASSQVRPPQGAPAPAAEAPQRPAKPSAKRAPAKKQQEEGEDKGKRQRRGR